MAVNPMLSSGANGIHQGIKALESVAQEIAELNVSDDTAAAESVSDSGRVGEMGEAIIDLKTYQRQVQMSAQVVQTADEVIGFLLDVRA